MTNVFLKLEWNSEKWREGEGLSPFYAFLTATDLALRFRKIALKSPSR